MVLVLLVVVVVAVVEEVVLPDSGMIAEVTLNSKTSKGVSRTGASNGSGTSSTERDKLLVAPDDEAVASVPTDT